MPFPPQRKKRALEGLEIVGEGSQVARGAGDHVLAQRSSFWPLCVSRESPSGGHHTSSPCHTCLPNKVQKETPSCPERIIVPEEHMSPRSMATAEAWAKAIGSELASYRD